MSFNDPASANPVPPLRQTGMMRHLTDEHWRKLIDTCVGTRTFPARTIITRAFTPLNESMLLDSGLIGRVLCGGANERSQMVALEVPGDFVDLHGMPLGRLDHDVIAMTDATVAVFSHDGLRDLIAQDPDLGLSLWSLTLIDAAIHRHWTFRVGSLRAVARMANFFCEMDTRLNVPPEVGEFPLPLTQRDLGQICGLTPVHVNRVMKDLREGGCCTLRNGCLIVHDRDRLAAVGDFDPANLFLPEGMPGRK